jgi:hypothetical protein
VLSHSVPGSGVAVPLGVALGEGLDEGLDEGLGEALREALACAFCFGVVGLTVGLAVGVAEGVADGVEPVDEAAAQSEARWSRWTMARASSRLVAPMPSRTWPSKKSGRSPTLTWLVS